ncbi:Protein required for ethanol metabolism, partial [Cladochytrium tenue]
GGPARGAKRDRTASATYHDLHASAPFRPSLPSSSERDALFHVPALQILRRFPTTTQAATTCALFIVGDWTAQHGVERRRLAEHDVERTLRLAFYGGFFAVRWKRGPIVALWYPFLQRIVRVKSPFRALVYRVALDQLAYAPVAIAFFFSYNAILEGRGIEGVKERLERGYASTLLNNWKLWPFVQIVNFRFVPVLYQSLVVNATALGWNTYMSYTNSRLGKKKAAKQEATEQ